MKLQAYTDPLLPYAIQLFDRNLEEIPFEFNTFPDSQLQVKIQNNGGYPYLVIASIFSPAVLDLFFQILEGFAVEKVKINYLYGARCDKSVSGGYLVANVAEQMLCRLQDYSERMQIEFLAPHCFNDIIDASDYIGKVNFALPDCVNLDDYDLVIYPDESAAKRFEDIDKDFIICEKHRDQETGKIISHTIPNLPDTAQRVILIDDLCDGGATFVNVAENLKLRERVDLFIFHGVFSNNAPIRLFDYFNNIYVSNSLPHVEGLQSLYTMWKDDKIGYKEACEQLEIYPFLQYKNFKPGNFIVFDVWNPN